MANPLEELRKLLKERDEQSPVEKLETILKEKEEGKAEPGSADINQVEKIVETMKKKYEAEGLSDVSQNSGMLKQLKSDQSMADNQRVDISKLEGLSNPQTEWLVFSNNIYVSVKDIFDPMIKIASKLELVNKLEHDLDSAGMKYTKEQYLTMAVVLAGITALFIGLLSSIILVFLKMPIFLSVVFLFIGFVVALMVALLIPKSKATQRGVEINRELPFALRHMATELKSGIGLYRTMQSVASSDYGVLSEEMSKTIAEIEEGVDTKEALKHLGDKTTSKGLKKALTHIIRALRTGGNLSQIMNDIAADVSFELRNDIREFSEKMNFFGVLFIFIAIVAPVFVAILGAIRAAPIGSGGVSFFSSLPITSFTMAIIYLLILPMFFFMVIYYINSAQPRV